jgi:N-acetylglucosamine kinase-like BadF-type ATPase
MFLAVDAGGTSTRAVVLDSSGRAFGYGRAAGGNPTAGGIAGAVAAIGEAARRAGSGLTAAEHQFATATVAMAGEQSPVFAERLTERLEALGWPRVHLQHDLLGIFGSGTHEAEGYALVAGTGSVAARIVGGRLDHVVGGRGWLLGDAGSGFWIGHRVACAVMAALDGQQPATALTPLVLHAVGIVADLDSAAGRAAAARQLMSVLYARRPVRLAELAPLAFSAQDDPTARTILRAASEALAGLFAAVRRPDLGGPVVVGGSVLVQGLLRAPPELPSALTSLTSGAALIPVSDGLVGTAVLGLRDAGIIVGEGMFARVRGEVARVAG